MRRLAVAVAVAAAMALLGCKDAGPLRAVAFRYCGPTPVFFAFAPPGGNWTAVLQETGGVFRFSAPALVRVAFTRSNGSAFTTYVFSLTNAELAAFAEAPCTGDVTVSRYLNGSISNVPAGSAVFASMLRSSAFIDPSSSTNFNLGPMPASGGFDLVAQTERIVSGLRQVERLTIRRAVNLPHGSLMPALNFTVGGESRGLTANTLNLIGLAGDESNSIELNFRTSRGTTHEMLPSSSVGNGTRPIYGVPSDMTVAGDMHTLSLVAEHASGAVRGVTRYYRSAGDQLLALGPPLAAPAVSLGVAPETHLKVELASQTEYDGFVYAQLSQPACDGCEANRWLMLTSAGFLGGTPATWSLATPDLHGLSSFPATALVNASAFDWSLAAFRGPVSLFLGGFPQDGHAISFATASSGGATTGAPRLFPRETIRR